ncbi:hypothetical protein SEA_JACKIEB_64 [Streptomyces phage JackieB]|nr:hypothetical protein SEA_JACKIEB_64 [Streptomyces phage JackieB]
MTLAQNNGSDAALFVAIMGTMLLGCAMVVIAIQAREKYGVMPRGLRWLETGIPALRRGTARLGTRIFYGDVLKAREAEKLRLEREHGMTPWWDDNTKQWRKGDVKEIKNQYNFVIARRPADYQNRVATPVRIEKGENA